MSLVATLAAAAQEAEHHGNVALDTLIYGVIAAAIFGTLALVTVSYRNVAHRHSHKTEDAGAVETAH